MIYKTQIVNKPIYTSKPNRIEMSPRHWDPLQQRTKVVCQVHQPKLNHQSSPQGCRDNKLDQNPLVPLLWREGVFNTEGPEVALAPETTTARPFVQNIEGICKKKY